MATIEERLEALNEKCRQCRSRSKIFKPSSDRCEYHCTIGAQIRRLDAEKDVRDGTRGFGSHQNW